MRRLTFLLVLIFSLPAFSQAKHPFTFEDMMKLKRVGEPVPSPDGKWVLFAAVDVDLAANKKTSHIWIVPLAGGQERVLVADQDGDRPRWAPNGKRFAFLSTTAGGSQVWIADFDSVTGAVTAVDRLTAMPTEAGNELWSPDGKNILFTSDVYPECDGEPMAELACNADRLYKAEQSKVKAQIFTHLLYRHWNAYKQGKRTHIFVVSASSTEAPINGKSLSSSTVVPVKLQSTPTPTTSDLPSKIEPQTIEQVSLGGGPMKLKQVPLPRDLTPGDYDAPVFSLGGQDNYAFSPDGQEICYSSNHDKVEATSTNNDLWIVPVSVGAGDSPAQVLAKTKNITADNPASDSTPLYSPDGKYIAYRAQQRPGYESDRFRLMLYERKTGEKTDLTEGFDRWAGTFTWAPDSRMIYFSADHKGHSLLYALGVLS